MKKLVLYYGIYLFVSVLVLAVDFCPSMGWGGFFPLWEVLVVASGPINYMLIYLAFPFYLLFTAINFSLVYKIHSAQPFRTKAILALATVFLWIFSGWLVLRNVLFI